MIVIHFRLISRFCAIKLLIDYVLDFYVKTVIQGTRMDLLGDTDLFIEQLRYLSK